MFSSECIAKNLQKPLKLGKDGSTVSSSLGLFSLAGLHCIVCCSHFSVRLFWYIFWYFVILWIFWIIYSKSWARPHTNLNCFLSFNSNRSVIDWTKSTRWGLRAVCFVWFIVFLGYLEIDEKQSPDKPWQAPILGDHLVIYDKSTCFSIFPMNSSPCPIFYKKICKLLGQLNNFKYSKILSSSLRCFCCCCRQICFFWHTE